MKKFYILGALALFFVACDKNSSTQNADNNATKLNCYVPENIGSVVLKRYCLSGKEAYGPYRVDYSRHTMDGQAVLPNLTLSFSGNDCSCIVSEQEVSIKLK